MSCFFFGFNFVAQIRHRLLSVCPIFDLYSNLVLTNKKNIQPTTEQAVDFPPRGLLGLEMIDNRQSSHFLGNLNLITKEAYREEYFTVASVLHVIKIRFSSQLPICRQQC